MEIAQVEVAHCHGTRTLKRSLFSYQLQATLSPASVPNFRAPNDETESGTGLSVVIAKTIVEMHGHITVSGSDRCNPPASVKNGAARCCHLPDGKSSNRVASFRFVLNWHHATSHTGQ